MDQRDIRPPVYIVFDDGDVKLITREELEALKRFKALTDEGRSGLEIKEFDMDEEY